MEPSPISSDTVLCNQCGHSFKGSTETHRSRTTWNRLRGNYVPSAPEAIEIRRILSAAELHMENYEKEISRISEIHEKLIRERDLLQRHIEDHQSLISTIHTVPNEILVKIFEFASSYNLDTQGRVPSQSICRPMRLTPFNLSLVCCLWRDIVLSRRFGNLWTTIAVDLCDLRNPVRTLGILGFFLKRSGCLSITISLHASLDLHEHPALDGGHSTASFLIRFVQAINPHADRWQHLRFFGFAAEYLALTGSYGDLFRNRMLPSLESLDINLCDRLIFPPQQSLTRELAPRLSSLRLYAVDSWRPWWHADLCWLLATFYDVEDVTLTESSYLDDGSETDPVNLYTSYLTSFTLDVPKTARNPRVLRCLCLALNLPWLTRLKIVVSPGAPVDWPHEEFQTFLLRSECPLEELDCRGVSFADTKTLCDAFPLLPNLTYLRIDNSPTTHFKFVEGVLRQLTVSNEIADGSSRFFLPSLQHLDLQTADPDFPVKVFSEMAELRLLRVAHLRTITPSLGLLQVEHFCQRLEAAEIDEAIDSLESLALTESLHESMMVD